jgi:hypothetical protein
LLAAFARPAIGWVGKNLFSILSAKKVHYGVPCSEGRYCQFPSLSLETKRTTSEHKSGNERLSPDSAWGAVEGSTFPFRITPCKLPSNRFVTMDDHDTVRRVRQVDNPLHSTLRWKRIHHWIKKSVQMGGTKHSPSLSPLRFKSISAKKGPKGVCRKDPGNHPKISKPTDYLPRHCFGDREGDTHIRELSGFHSCHRLLSLRVTGDLLGQEGDNVLVLEPKS